MALPKWLKYTDEHEWVNINGNIGNIGITDFAQQELGEVVYIEFPEIGEAFAKNDEFGSVESVKAVSSLYMPVSGEILEVNELLEDQPELINDDPFGKGWIIKVKIENLEEIDSLLYPAEYERLCSGEYEHVEQIKQVEEENDDNFIDDV